MDSNKALILYKKSTIVNFLHVIFNEKDWTKLCDMTTGRFPDLQKGLKTRQWQVNFFVIFLLIFTLFIKN